MQCFGAGGGIQKNAISDGYSYNWMDWDGMGISGCYEV